MKVNRSNSQPLGPLENDHQAKMALDSGYQVLASGPSVEEQNATGHLVATSSRSYPPRVGQSPTHAASRSSFKMENSKPNVDQVISEWISSAPEEVAARKEIGEIIRKARLSGINELSLEGSDATKSITSLPDLFAHDPQFQSIALDNFPSLKELPPMGENLKSLTIAGCHGLTLLPALPDGLEKLDTYKSDAKIRFWQEKLPGSLRHLFAGGMVFSNLKKFPQELTAAYFYDCSTNENTLLMFSKSLKTLSVHGGQFRYQAPEDLEELELYKRNISKFDFPEGVQAVTLSNCRQSDQNFTLPDSIRSLTVVVGNIALARYPNLLEKLNLKGLTFDNLPLVPKDIQLQISL